MKIFFLAIVIILSSCSYIPWHSKGNKRKSLELKGYVPLEKKDYVDHFLSLKNDYLDSSETKNIALGNSNQKYLQNIVDTIIKNNELFFTNTGTGKIYILNDEIPFHFSLPGRNIFISNGLVKKYIKSEDILFCLLTYELIISEKNIYHKRIIIPTGDMTTQRILSLLKLTIDEKVEIHKWAFYLLKRVGVDPDNYLSWLQIQNRNSVDFSLQLGDVSSISREESMFKAFIIQNADKKKNKQFKGSSKEFYTFVKALKR